MNSKTMKKRYSKLKSRGFNELSKQRRFDKKTSTRLNNIMPMVGYILELGWDYF